MIELRRLSAEDPGGRWFLPLAALLLEQQAIAEAQQLVRYHLARDPDAIGGWVLLGRSYWMSGELPAARRIMTSVLARDPENAHALRVRAQAEAELGEREAAIHGYRTLLRLVPGDLAAQEALALLLDHVADVNAGNGRRGSGSDREVAAEEAAVTASNGRESIPGALSRARPRGRPALARAEREGEGQGGRRRERARARPRPPAPAAERALLPPARRPRTGIFESLPADLDWGRKVAPPAAKSERAAPSAGREARRESHQGYRRWLDQMLSRRIPDEQRRAESESESESEPSADA
jgi:tetratricopeptide (TPR) repeat protein